MDNTSNVDTKPIPATPAASRARRRIAPTPVPRNATTADFSDTPTTPPRTTSDLPPMPPTPVKRRGEAFAISPSPPSARQLFAVMPAVPEDCVTESPIAHVAKQAKKSSTQDFRLSSNPFSELRTDQIQSKPVEMSISRWAPVRTTAHAATRSPWLFAEFTTPREKYSPSSLSFTDSAVCQQWESFYKSVLQPAFAKSLSSATDLFSDESSDIFNANLSAALSSGFDCLDYSAILRGRVYFHFVPAGVSSAAAYQGCPDWHVYRLGLPRVAVFEIARSLIEKFGLTFSHAPTFMPEEDALLVSSMQASTLLSGSVMTGSGPSSTFSWIVFTNAFPSSQESLWNTQRRQLTLIRSALCTYLSGDSSSGLVTPYLDLPTSMPGASVTNDHHVNYQLWMGYCTTDELLALRAQPFMVKTDKGMVRNPQLTNAAISKLSSSASIIYFLHALLHYLLSPLNSAGALTVPLNNTAELGKLVALV